MSAPTSSEQPRPRNATVVVLICLVLASSLFMRLWRMDGYLTNDEPLWADWSKQFRNALVQGDPSLSYQPPQPGITTLWAGTLGSQLWAALDGTEGTQQVTDPATPPGIDPVTLWGRRVVAAVTWLGIVLMVVLIWKALGRRVAVVAAILISLDPFYLGHSRIHHMDALLATFIALSVLGWVLAERSRLRWQWVALSGLFAGLGFASKATAAFLAPGVLLLLTVRLVSAWRTHKAKRDLQPWALVGRGALWGSCMLLAIVAVWPALWVAPAQTLQLFYEGIRFEAGTPHMLSQFFLGVIRPDPGPAYYVIVWLTRTTPLIVLGVIGALANRPQSAVARNMLRSIWLFALVLLIFVTLTPKKMDRYLLPVFPLMDVLAATGLVTLAQQVARSLSPRGGGEDVCSRPLRFQGRYACSSLS